MNGYIPIDDYGLAFETIRNAGLAAVRKSISALKNEGVIIRSHSVGHVEKVLPVREFEMCSTPGCLQGAVSKVLVDGFFLRWCRNHAEGIFVAFTVNVVINKELYRKC